MIHAIHKTVIKRLVVSWVLLSLAVGSLTLYLEMEAADDAIVALAVHESETFTGENLHRINQAGADLTALREKATEFLKSHFVIVELYNRQKKKILEEVEPGKDSVEHELKKRIPFRWPIPLLCKLLTGGGFVRCCCVV
jgi:hypothetical protein